MKEIQRILSYVRRAVSDYRMIEDGDRVCVGVSAGKDSLTLLIALHELQRFYEKKFTICAATVDLGFPDADYGEIKELCRRLGIEYRVVNTEIGKVVFDIRKESNPCSLCAKMRRGALHVAAQEMGCNRVALGHHFDDAVETFMLNLFYEGRIGCFSPVSYLSNRRLYLIRPMVYVPEKAVRYFANRVELPVAASKCPANGNTERERMKVLLRELEKENKGLRHRIFGAMQRGKVDGFTDVGRMPNDD
ncbi:MAG: tRNA 2-thiocytidine(32) synthetase TtcA [Clostridia bacterium]|nr:tRNA 2-thiocytidine(32) synthetase TtcA [Clostridia bacterium]